MLCVRCGRPVGDTQQVCERCQQSERLSQVRPASVGLTAGEGFLHGAAPIYRRLGAALLDLSIMLSLGTVVIYQPPVKAYILRVAKQVSGSPQLSIAEIELALTIGVIVIGFGLIGIVYTTIFEGGPIQASLGKFLFGLNITTTAGRRCGVQRALLRGIFKFFGIITAGLTLLPALFNERKQTAHDIICDTVVVQRERADFVLSFAKLVCAFFLFLVTVAMFTNMGLDSAAGSAVKPGFAVQVETGTSGWRRGE